jgi:hypothetical protein
MDSLYSKICDGNYFLFNLSTSRLGSGVNFIYVLRAAFVPVDPECAKKDSQVSIVILRFWALRA